ncbi:hypothetical protein LCGC14_2546730 [marine sediment metagenome]|uniref:Uncharacterized protein n=1 Tax=marine sediment metagenome TaxID=412755 RepID=A0A0F9D0J3_9ZZZZ
MRNIETTFGTDMAEIEKKWCAICEEDKPLFRLEHFKCLKYENNLLVHLIIKPVNGFICEDCGEAMLNSIIASKLMRRGLELKN